MDVIVRSAACATTAAAACYSNTRVNATARYNTIIQVLTTKHNGRILNGELRPGVWHADLARGFPRPKNFTAGGNTFSFMIIG